MCAWNGEKQGTPARLLVISTSPLRFIYKRGSIFGAHDFLCGEAAGKLYGDPGSFAPLALHLDRSVHEPDEMVYHREAQARSLVGSVLSHRRLLEGAK